MSYVRPNGLIDPHKRYDLDASFTLVDHVGVYVTTEYAAHGPHPVVDFAKIPYSSGTIYYCIKTNDVSDSRAIPELGDLYTPKRSVEFTKGPYVGEVYELARKVDYINRNLRAGEVSSYQGVRFSHEGNALRGNAVIELDLDALEETYQATRARAEPCAYYGEKASQAAQKIVCAAAFAFPMYMLTLLAQRYATISS